jgi:hypothetical protein
MGCLGVVNKMFDQAKMQRKTTLCARDMARDHEAGG